MEKKKKKEDIPKTPKILYIFEPNTFPRAKSTFLLKADRIPTDNSGKEVPNAIKVAPITDSETPKVVAIFTAAPTKNFDP